MENHTKELLEALIADVEAMLDSRFNNEGEYYLSGFSNSFVDADGEFVVSWPNLRWHIETAKRALSNE
jgi:hypothetical protein